MRKGRRQKFKSAGEHDVVYGRHVYCYLKKAGVSKKIKRAMNKRARREGREEAKENKE